MNNSLSQHWSTDKQVVNNRSGYALHTPSAHSAVHTAVYTHISKFHLWRVLINPRRACAGEGYCTWSVCVCVRVCVCPQIRVHCFSRQPRQV